MSELCGFCGGRDNLQRCARCQIVLYCSKDHQRAHWKVHRKLCVPKNCDVVAGVKGENLPIATTTLKSAQAVGINVLEVHNHASLAADQSLSSVSQNGTHSSEPPVVIPVSVKSKKSSRKNKISARMNSNNNNNVVHNNHHHNNNNCIPTTRKIDDNNLENHAPFPDGQVNLVTGSPGTPSTPTNSSGHGVGNGVVVNNSKTTPVSATPLISTSPAVNASTSGMLLQTNNKKVAPFFHRNLQPNASQFSSMWVLNICQQVINDMDRFGVCVVDNLLGDERGCYVFKEVQSLYTTGAFKDGQVVKEQKETRTGVSQTIRGDKIAWVDGKEPFCENISFLISLIDSIVMGANKIKNNGKLGSYTIRERTKAMIACYPGSGTHYVKHVDNPNQDGRCITSIYYLNKDWNTKENGGLLRIFPEGWTNQVADIEPLFDRVLFFWSDRRNPHEVQPAYRTRYAITLWYFDAEERERARRDQNSRTEQLQQLS